MGPGAYLPFSERVLGVNLRDPVQVPPGAELNVAAVLPDAVCTSAPHQSPEAAGQWLHLKEILQFDPALGKLWGWTE